MSDNMILTPTLLDARYELEILRSQVVSAARTYTATPSITAFAELRALLIAERAAAEKFHTIAHEHSQEHT